MSNSRDEESREPTPAPTNLTPSVTRSRRCIPVLSKGKSGNPSGRTKGRTNFDMTLLKEFYKPVSATINGKPIKATNDKLFAASLVKTELPKARSPSSSWRIESNGLRLDWLPTPRPPFGKKPKRRKIPRSSNGPRFKSASTGRFALRPVLNPRFRGAGRSRQTIVELRI
jgi:Family of unknown function (DUF5681)